MSHAGATGPVVAVPLRATGLRLRRGRRTILADVSLDLRAGEIAAVLGPNGSGKSTLLAALAGLRPLERDGGRVELLGRPLAAYTRAGIARRLAFLPARTDLPFPLTVAELVDHGRPELEARAAALEAMELMPLLGTPVTRLSTGEARRAWLAMTLARATSVLLLDEPLSGLDPRYQVRLLDALRERARQGASVLLVAHDLPYAARADRVIALGGGRIMADGPAGELLRPKLLRELYGVEVWVGTDPATGAVVPLATRAV